MQRASLLDAAEPGQGPVTTTVTRRVRPGHEVAYEQFLAGIISAASEFPGHLGVEVFSPRAQRRRVSHRLSLRHRRAPRAWLDSDEHAAWLERAEPHVIGPMRTSFVTGLETWFTLPGRPGPPPPPYKMALLTWITIFPLITAIVAITGPLLEGLPLAGRLGITTALAVPLMTWVVMPRVTRLLRGWLYPDHLAPPPTGKPRNEDSQGLQAPDPRRWRALALLGTAFFMVILDGTIVITALPVIGHGSGFPPGACSG